MCYLTKIMGKAGQISFSAVGSLFSDSFLDKEIKAKAEKAAILLGHKSLAVYMVNIIDENATQASSHQ